MMFYRTIFMVVFVISSSLVIADDPCRFRSTQGLIDLTTLGRTDGIPAYLDVLPATGLKYKYSYNPCTPFSRETGCQNVAVCQVTFNALYTYVLGTQESAKWDDGSSLGVAPSVSYSYRNKTVQISLICSNDTFAIFEASNEETINNYKFRLTHSCACWNGCTAPPTPTISETTTTIEVTTINTETTSIEEITTSTEATASTEAAASTNATTTISSNCGSNSIGGISVFFIVLLILAFIYSS